MSATYDTSLSTDKDHVRFLIGDTIVDPVTSALLSDEEIAATLGAEEVQSNVEARRYYAAATCLRAIQARLAHKGKGMFSKTVSRLSITWGQDSNVATALASRIAWLESRGAELVLGTSRVFRVMGGSRTRSR